MASGTLSAVAAETLWNFANPDLPADATAAFVALNQRSETSLAQLPQSTLVADGQAACRAFVGNETPTRILSLESARGLSQLESYLVPGFAAATLCQNEFSKAVMDLLALWNAGTS